MEGGLALRLFPLRGLLQTRFWRILWDLCLPYIVIGRHRLKFNFGGEIHVRKVGGFLGDRGRLFSEDSLK